MLFDRRPNIVLIHADELRADCVGNRHGRRPLYTPALNSMANEGATFESAYSACPICIPQRMTLLTGLNAEHHGVMGMTGIPYLETGTTLPSVLKKGGYQTALVGRGTHTYPYCETYGFEYYRPGDPTMFGNGPDYFEQYLNNNLKEDERDYFGNGTTLNSRLAAPFHLSEAYHQTNWATNRALEFLRNRDDSRPFFLCVGYLAPHTPLNPPAEYFRRYYEQDAVDAPYIADYDTAPCTNGGLTAHYVSLEGEELKSAEAAYYGLISHMDAQLSRLLNALLYTNTYIIFTSDHGEMLGDHYCMHKAKSWQGAVHIPMLVKGPGISGGSRFDAPVGWADLMPTILELAGVPVPEGLDGKSFAGLMRGASKEALQLREYIHGQTNHINYRYFGNYASPAGGTLPGIMDEAGSHYLTDGHMKYIWYVTDGREQLFDLDHDYGELEDLSCNPAWQDTLLLWRGRMVQTLTGREEGYVADGKLVPGITPPPLSNAARELHDRRNSEYLSSAYDRPVFLAGPKGYINHL